jgi:hypothetical protein
MQMVSDQMQLLLYGTPGRTFLIEQVDQLSSPVPWNGLCEITLTNSPAIVLTNCTGPSPGSSFYRAVLSQPSP